MAVEQETDVFYAETEFFDVLLDHRSQRRRAAIQKDQAVRRGDQVRCKVLAAHVKNVANQVKWGIRARGRFERYMVLLAERESRSQQYDQRRKSRARHRYCSLTSPVASACSCA